MNDFLNHYDYLYHFTFEMNRSSISEKGLLPKVPDGSLDKAQDPIVCFSLRDRAISNVNERLSYPDRPELLICKVAVAALMNLRLGLDWSSASTREEHRKGRIARFTIMSNANHVPSVVHALEVVGSMACYDAIPPEAIEFLSVAELNAQQP